MQTTKTKRVFQLRKTGSVRQPNNQQSRVVEPDESPSNANNEGNTNRDAAVSANDSHRFQGNQSARQQDTVLVSHPEIMVDQQELHFHEKIHNVQVKNIKVTNIGSSAIYFQWNFKNLPKLNPNAIKDPKPNFYCHYQPNVIKPGQQEIFSFSFFSETPGAFTEEIELLCTPEPATPVCPIRLKGVAYIEDTLQTNRAKLAHELKEKSTEAFTKQVLSDIVSQVKSPVPPPPDVSNPQIAEREFQASNLNEKLYYNAQVHKWFSNLYKDICNECEIPEESRYWNQSVRSLAQMIANVKDPILQESFDKRLQNYKSLSCTRPPQKSDLFSKIKQSLLQVGYALGGSLADQSKKELQMWEIPFEEPSQNQTEQEAAAKKDERNKIVAEWAKKMKKKKWGPQEENQMNTNLRTKLEQKASKTLIQKFDGFDDQANFQICEAKIKEKFKPEKYFDFLQRMKTVEEFSIEGKKILLKFDLKLKQNNAEALEKLDQYLRKKKQQELRIEQQKKNQEANKAKKKAAPPKKKKGQKQQQETKVLSYDFNTLLDQQSWEGLVSTLRFIIEKQPILLIIGISFGPKVGVFRQKESIKFLLEPLKAIEPSIQFLEHKDLLELRHKIAEETLNQGSIFLTENLSFLPCQGMEIGEVKIIQRVQNGEPKKLQQVETQKMLMCQVENQLQQLMPSIDIIVREDRLVNRVSGICSYGKKLSILGSAWWKYIAVALRAKGSFVLLGGNFTPEKLVLLDRLAKYSGKIYLAGQLAVKIWMATQDLDNFYGVKNTKNQQQFIKYFLECQKTSQTLQKIVLPTDFILLQTKQDLNNKIQYEVSQKYEPNEHLKVIDLGQKSCQQIENIKSGHLFIIDCPSINRQSTTSLQRISKVLYTKKQQKKESHLKEQSSPAGINYEKDLVVYMIGIDESEMDKIQLKQKKIKQKQDDQQEQQQEPEPQEQVKRIDQVCDFRLNDTSYFLSLLSAQFNYGLKDVSHYPKSD